jgi:hypothetical protein
MNSSNEKSNENQTATKSKINKVFWWLIGFCIFLTASTVSISYLATYFKDSLDRQVLLSTTLEENYVRVNNELEIVIAENKQLTSDLESLSKRLDGIKDQDDLLRRDIELYIDQKFKLVPKVLCKDIAENVVKFSNELDVSPELVVGIIEVESAFNPMAMSNKKARGLMQLMPEWAEKFGLKDVDDFHDVDVNIKHGIKVLKIHIEQDGKGNVTKGLYYYVGKDKTYADLVYKAMGKFVSFRYTVDDGEQNGDENAEEGETETLNEPAESNPPPGGSLTQRPN